MNATINVLFYIKRAKINKQGLAPIFLRITLEGKRLEKSTGKYIFPDKWNTNASNVKGNSEESRLINNYLDLVKNSIFEIEKKLFLKDCKINFENFKNEFLGINEKQRMLIPIFEDHNKKMSQLIGTEYAPGTYERYQTTLKHTQEFLKWKFSASDINIEKIDLAFITEYEFYLRTQRNCANNTAVKYIKNFHKIINLCLANNWLTKNPFVNYKSKIKEVVREFLTEQEMNDIIHKEFVSERLELVRDIFIFSCFTGLAYVDVKQLSNDNIVVGIDGEKWINKKRQKTDTNSKIPLLPMALQIINKYSSHPSCKNENKLLPVLSNQKMNAYLKEIADVCGINKELTFHIARHTFATSITLSNGVPIETVSKMLGHTNLKTTQHYAKILDKKISDDMQSLKNKFTMQNNLKLITKNN